MLDALVDAADGVRVTRLQFTRVARIRAVGSPDIGAIRLFELPTEHGRDVPYLAVRRLEIDIDVSPTETPTRGDRWEISWQRMPEDAPPPPILERNRPGLREQLTAAWDGVDAEITTELHLRLTGWRTSFLSAKSRRLDAMRLRQRAAYWEVEGGVVDSFSPYLASGGIGVIAQSTAHLVGWPDERALVGPMWQDLARMVERAR